MYLADADIEAALKSGALIVHPATKVDPTSIDLHLDSVDQARVWDVERLAQDNRDLGLPQRELNIARMHYGTISRKYLIPPPHAMTAPSDARVIRRDDGVVLRPLGFLLWQTREIVGTPARDPRHICFIDGKSTRARTGLVVHLTAPTIHAGWSGNVTLELTNLGPLDLVLHEGDAVAQITIAQISCVPRQSMQQAGSATLGQTDVTGGGNMP